MQRSFWKPYTIVDRACPCPTCGYSLAGLNETVARCPECGRELSLYDRVAEYRFKPVWHSVRDVCVWPALAAGALLLLDVLSIAKRGGFASFLPAAIAIVWLLGGMGLALQLILECLRTRTLRRGRLRSEHLARIGYAGAGLFLVMVLPAAAMVFMF